MIWWVQVEIVNMVSEGYMVGAGGTHEHGWWYSKTWWVRMTWLVHVVLMNMVGAGGTHEHGGCRWYS